jgi:ribosomal protein L18E
VDFKVFVLPLAIAPQPDEVVLVPSAVVDHPAKKYGHPLYVKAVIFSAVSQMCLV